MVNSLKDGLNVPDVIASGASIQIKEFVSSAGSVATVSFDAAFSSAPLVVVSVVGGLASQPGVSAGSTVFNTTSASASGTVIAFLGN